MKGGARDATRGAETRVKREGMARARVPQWRRQYTKRWRGRKGAGEVGGYQSGSVARELGARVAQLRGVEQRRDFHVAEEQGVVEGLPVGCAFRTREGRRRYA